MNNVELKTIFAIGLIVLGACNSINPKVKYQSAGGHIIKQPFDSNNYLIKEEHLTMDSINNGLYAEYAKDRIQVIGSFLNGKKDSTWTYLDGWETIKGKENWFNGKKFGRQILYYPKKEGEIVSIVQSISFLNLEGKEIFRAEFDMKGTLINIAGVPLYYAYNKSNLTIGDSLEVICFFSVIPGCLSELSLEERNKESVGVLMNKVVCDTSSEVISLPYASKYYFEKVYNKKGQL